MPQKQAEWTVMVFLNAKNNLEQYSFLNFDQMAQVGSTDKVNVLVEFGRPQHHYVNYYGGWSQTLRFRVAKGMEPTVANAVQQLGAVNMGDGAALADFVRWAKHEYPAKHTMLVLWDHGQGWRLRSALAVRAPEPDRAKLAASRRAAREEAGAAARLPDDMRLHGAFRYVSHDDDTGDKLYNREIQDTLEAMGADGQIDVIGFDACLMAMIETGYALRNVAKVMVASEELEPGDGWDYTPWLKALTAKPASTPAEVGKLVVDAYKAYYHNTQDATLSALDVTKVPAAATAVGEFADAATAQLAGQLSALKTARGNCRLYAPGHGLNSIDLAHFLGEVKGPLSAKATAAAKAVKATVLGNYAATSRKSLYGSTGMAVYFPASKLEYTHDPDHDGYEPANKLYPVQFVQDNKWAAFLHAYHVKVPR